MKTYEITFDGGSKGNPGRGYGSYQIASDGAVVAHEQLSFDHLGNAVTNNQAEYLTLLHALERVAMERQGALRDTRVVVWGDSQLVINQLAGRWKVSNLGLQPLHQRGRTLLAAFGAHQLNWHARANSVRILGH